MEALGLSCLVVVGGGWKCLCDEVEIGGLSRGWVVFLVVCFSGVLIVGGSNVDELFAQLVHPVGT